jgi:hypothetical protein
VARAALRRTSIISRRSRSMQFKRGPCARNAAQASSQFVRRNGRRTSLAQADERLSSSNRRHTASACCSYRANHDTPLTRLTGTLSELAARGPRKAGPLPSASVRKYVVALVPERGDVGGGERRAAPVANDAVHRRQERRIGAVRRNSINCTQQASEFDYTSRPTRLTEHALRRFPPSHDRE